MNNQSRPARNQIATSRFDVPPHWRWAWDNLFALYIPYAGDGWTIPNRAPGYGHLKLQHEGVPVYSGRGVVMETANSRASCPFTERLYERQLGTSRLSMMWGGIDPRAAAVGATYTGYAGINAGGANVTPYFLMGIERNGTARQVNVVSARTADAYVAVGSANLPAPLTEPICIVVSRNYRDTGGANLAATVDPTNNGFYGPGIQAVDPAGSITDWGFSSLASPRPQLFIGNRYAGDISSPGITTGIFAAWFKVIPYRQMLRLQASPYEPFTKWKRQWSAALFRTLRPTLDLSNSGWVTP